MVVFSGVPAGVGNCTLWTIRWVSGVSRIAQGIVLLCAYVCYCIHWTLGPNWQLSVAACKGQFYTLRLQKGDGDNQVWWIGGEHTFSYQASGQVDANSSVNQGNNSP